MCGRYYIDDTTAREVEKAVGRLDGKLDMTGGDVLPSRGGCGASKSEGTADSGCDDLGLSGDRQGKTADQRPGGECSGKENIPGEYASQTLYYPGPGIL